MSEKRIRYGDFLGAVTHHQRVISFNAVAELSQRVRVRPRLRPIDLHRLLTPYVGVRFLAQVRAVLPLAALLVFFPLLALGAGLGAPERATRGVLGVIAGLMLFLEGVKHGLMPFSERIGYGLPQRASLALVLAVAVALGAAATFAEPAIGALQAGGAGVDRVASPVLAMLLGAHSGWLVGAVAAGVGTAVALAVLRLVFGWTLKALLLAGVPPALALTFYAAGDPQLSALVALAWDCGGITTGPVTVPLVLALGVGVAAATGRADNPLAGFGIVTLASLLPAVLVLAAGIALRATGVVETAAAPPAADGGWLSATPWAEIALALQAIVPLVLLLWAVQRLLIGEPIRDRGVLTYGIVLAIFGMALFNIGLSQGLIPLGEHAGTSVPRAFVAGAGAAPLYSWAVGVAIALGFAAAVGYGATLAEPALSALGATVENLTDGALRQRLLMHAVAGGVALGCVAGVAKILFGLPMHWLLAVSYALALLLTAFSSDEYVNLAWDSAGVTTGPVTVPLILALGLGVARAVGAADGFGILAMASVGPVITVLAAGLWVRYRSQRAREALA